MSISTRSKLAGLFTLLVVLLTTFQGLIPAMPIGNPTVLTTVSAFTMFFVSALTVWKQFLSNEIDNKAMWPTLIVAIVATVGLLNDILNVVHLSGAVGQWVRFGITAVTMMLNMASKILWPTDETVSKI